ncbi:MAG: tRNA (N(6)-L-threonylcarbamoyladenosine(37)-C(2))-methylthiotransferase MtaB [Clostridia bacterium]|nr:tRNA (N(6)-L-threonylcarbamoyladenosine(37)-C(2))-methylthiotransferase MtaB [Clostridia bacterium]
MERKTVRITTLGCKVNQYESEAIAEALEARGFEILKDTQACDAYIINTCTVTAESDRKARQMIRRMIARNPDAFILVTGCYSQVSPEAVASIEGVDYVCGSSNKMSVVDKLSSLVEKGKPTSAEICVPPLDNAKFECMSITRFDRTRAYVKIEDGCESKCTYCTIPAARGQIRSKPFNDVIDEVKELITGGCAEVVLTGIETGSYGADLEEGQDLANLLCEIDKLEGIGRVRLGSLDPTVIKPAFVEKIKDLKSLAPHFHLSLQSGSDKVLASMKRKYNSRQAMQSIERLREAIPDVKFTTDIITGFPGESDEDFEASCDFVRKAEFLMVHAFPYSKRKGTPAAEMKGQIPEDIKKQRVHLLTEICREVRSDMFDRIISEGKPQKVLFETFDGEYVTGHTADFIEVKVKSPVAMHGEIAIVKLVSHNTECCEGIFIKK